ncbi:hypothetical protein L3X38_007845 [Prunus dulcis]|uniref:BURP domain-containing protein n=1 Tax=Prunus dulcis TaxID=3755 RepID=A0AAD5F6J9_PRUDU|nr:hypothetical protein L3X38_007845 [Prunus dulcis]
MGSNVELVWPEAEAYSSRVNNCSHANSSLAAIRAKLSAEQLEQFKTSCFGHLLNIDKIQFSGQIVHGVVLRRDFCLITVLRFGEVPEVSSGESDEIRLQKRYFIDEGITCNALEEAFLRCTEEDDIYKLALVYFAELVVLGRDKHLNINLNYLTLVEDLDAFNRYPWGSVSFDKTQDSLFSAPTKYVKSFEYEEGRGKGKSKIWVYELIPRMADLNYCKVVDPTAVPRILRWRTTTSVPEMRKLNNYFFQSKESVQLRAQCPSEEEMRQPYWSWPQDRPAVVSAESIPSSCADLDEFNKVVSLLRSELFQVKREKDVLHLKVIRMEKLLDQCLGPQFEQEVRRDLALLKQRTNRCVVSHLFKGYGEMDDIQWDEGPSNRNEGEEKEDEGIEGGEGPTVLSQLNVWLNDKGKAVAQGVQLRKRKRIIPMWKIIEGSELVPKTGAQTTGLKMLDPMKAIPHDDLVNLLKLCWEWHQDPNLVMQFGNVEAEIEFFASLVKADGWLKGDNHIRTCFADNKRKKQQLGWKIRKSLLNVVNGKVPPCGMDWQIVYKVYTPFMLTKYKHWVAVMIDLVLCEIKVYDSKVSLILDDIVKEELAPLSITLPNLLNTIDFYEEGVYANNCSRDWWCPWPIERVDVPQQSNE